VVPGYTDPKIYVYRGCRFAVVVFIPTVCKRYLANSGKHEWEEYIITYYTNKHATFITNRTVDNLLESLCKVAVWLMEDTPTARVYNHATVYVKARSKGEEKGRLALFIRT
jgi:hypothetical protein